MVIQDPGGSDPLLLTAKQVAARLGVCVKTVRRLRDRGELPKSVKVGRSVRWKEEDIRRYIDEL